MAPSARDRGRGFPTLVYQQGGFTRGSGRLWRTNQIIQKREIHREYERLGKECPSVTILSLAGMNKADEINDQMCSSM